MEKTVRKENEMKVYVIYSESQWEGCSRPYVAFSTIELAEEFCKKSKYSDCYFEELIVDRVPNAT